MYRHTKPYSQTHTQKGKHQTKINTNKNMKNIHTINNNTIIHKRHHDATELSLHWMCLKKNDLKCHMLTLLLVSRAVISCIYKKQTLKWIVLFLIYKLQALQITSMFFSVSEYIRDGICGC